MCSCRYHMLGMFLLIQLSIVGGDWLRRCALPALATSMRSHAVDPLLTARGNFIHFSHLKYHLHLLLRKCVSVQCSSCTDSFIVHLFVIQVNKG
jgi:hypothetical protein